MTARVDLGQSDFSLIRNAGHVFVDKSMLMKAVLVDAQSKVDVILRPRRFGKSLNLSMMNFFFSNIRQAECRKLFESLAIMNDESFCAQHMGSYSVVNISFRECGTTQYTTWTAMRKMIWKAIYAMLSPYISTKRITLKQFVPVQLLADTEDMFPEGIDDGTLATILGDLVRALRDLDVKRKEVIVLVDEYDAPMNIVFNPTTRDEDEQNRRNFFSLMYSYALKDNSALRKALLVGGCRIRGAGILSGINNHSVYSISDPRAVYSDHFGFTEHEAKHLMDTALGMTSQDVEREWSRRKGIKDWYSGYRFGVNGSMVLNPWSFLNYIGSGGKCNSYWISTAAADSLFNALKADVGLGRAVAESIQGLVVPRRSKDNEELQVVKVRRLSTEVSIHTRQDWSRDKALSFLCLAGYLAFTPDGSHDDKGYMYVPNRELRKEWREVLAKMSGFAVYDDIITFYKNIIDAFAGFMIDRIEAALLMAMCKLGGNGDFKEYSYHLFTTGVLQVLKSAGGHIVKEKGVENGFADLVIALGNGEKRIIIAFKHLHKHEGLEAAAWDGLHDILERKCYESFPLNHKLLLIGCAISLEQVKLVHILLGKGERPPLDFEKIREGIERKRSRNI